MLEMMLAKACKFYESTDDTACTTMCEDGYTEWLQMRGFAS